MGSLLTSTEKRIREVGSRLYERVRAQYPKVTAAHPWEMALLSWCLKDAHLRTQVLRFLDCLPSLNTPRQVVEHLREYFPTRQMRLPLALRLGLEAANPYFPTAGAVALATRKVALAVARLFIAGATLEEGFAVLNRLEKDGFRVSADLLGETTVSLLEADRARDRYLELIRLWRSGLASFPHVSLKLSSLAFPFEPIDPEGVWRQIRPRLGAVLRAAFEQDGFVNIDMEQFHLRDLTLNLTCRLLDEEFPKESRVGLVIQAYLKDSKESAEQLLSWTRSRNSPITIRLVRGAYWDSEIIASLQRSWPLPVYTAKSQTDLAYERLIDFLLEHHEHFHVAIATHNLRSIARAVVKSQELNLPQDRWEVQVLYGMGEAIQRAVSQWGIPVRIYSPIGELIPGMAYLVRRILENTSHASFLTQSLMEQRPFEQLMEEPNAVPV